MKCCQHHNNYAVAHYYYYNNISLIMWAKTFGLLPGNNSNVMNLTELVLKKISYINAKH